MYIIKANPAILLNSLCLEKCWLLLHILNVNGVESMKYQHNDAEFKITDGKQKITDNASTLNWPSYIFLRLYEIRVCFVKNATDLRW